MPRFKASKPREELKVTSLPILSHSIGVGSPLHRTINSSSLKSSTLSANQSLCSKTVYSCPNGGTLNGTSCVVTKSPVSGGSNCFPEGADPQVMLRWSDDGGHTWSNEHWAKMGKIGQYFSRVLWRRLGMTMKIRDRVYEIS